MCACHGSESLTAIWLGTDVLHFVVRGYSSPFNRILSHIVTGLSPDGGREGGKDQGQPRPAIPAMRLHPPASPARLRLLRLALLPADLAANLLRVCAVQCTKASADEIVFGKQHQACRARLEGCAEERSCTCARHGF